eukprot:5904878-Prymnesium_polylepis.1
MPPPTPHHRRPCATACRAQVKESKRCLALKGTTAPTAALVTMLDAAGTLCCAAFSSDASILACGCGDSTVRRTPHTPCDSTRALCERCRARTHGIAPPPAPPPLRRALAPAPR